MCRLCKDHQKELEIANYKRFLTLAEIINVVLHSDDEHPDNDDEIVIICLSNEMFTLLMKRKEMRPT